MMQYALLSRSKPLLVENDGINKVKKSYRDELASIYESYAELYPNTKLVEEFRERDQLMVQAAAMLARRKQNTDAVDETPKASGLGRFFRFFGKQASDNDSSGMSNSALSEDDVLVYDDHVEQEGALCGMEGQLDQSAIPQEARSAARFHLASVRTNRDRPVLVRSTDAFSSSPTKALAIVGLGQIAEFQANPLDQSNSHSNTEELSAPTIKETSDREDLISYMSELDNPFELSYVRAISLGPNFLVVSWGLPDGVVVMYRRMNLPNLPEMGWESVAMFGPTRSTLDSLSGSGDLFAEDANGLVSSTLLRVTDMLPLVGEYPRNESTSSSPVPAATLVISRLGGYLELLPLTPRLWYGPALSPDNHQHRPRPRRRRKRKTNEPPEHYGIGKLFCFPSNDNSVAALSTLEHHSDVLCMDAFRAASEHLSRPEYLLATCGTNEGHEIVTFWKISTIFDDVNNSGQAGFFVEVSFLDKIDIGAAGPEVSLFADKVIWNKWRRPRRVRLRRLDHDNHDRLGRRLQEKTERLGEEEHQKIRKRMVTLSTAAPVLSLRFGESASSLVEGNHPGRADGQGSGLVIAALDWNGGVTVIECGGVYWTDRMAATRGVDPGVPSGASCTVLMHRSRTMKLPLRCENQLVVDIRWWRPRGIGPSSEEPVLVAATANGHFYVLDQSSTSDDSSRGWRAIGLSSEMAIPVKLAFIASTESGTLSFLLDQSALDTDAIESGVCLGSIQQVDAGDIIGSLVQAARYNDAVVAFESLDAGRQAELADNIGICHKSLWEKEKEVEHLEKVTDDSYVIQQVRLLFRTNTGNKHLDFDTIREASMIGLKRAQAMITSSRSRDTSVQTDKAQAEDTWGASVSFADGAVTELMGALVGLCTYVLLCRHLGHHWSFSLFKKKFLKSSPQKLAMAFAMKGDIVALTLLFHRHRRDLMTHRLDILNQVPVSTSASSYCHLLPVGMLDGDSDSLFVPLEDTRGQLHWSQMPTHIRPQIDVFIDQRDEKIVLGYSTSMESNNLKESRERARDNIGSWYLDRARYIQTKAGNLAAVVEFCDFAMKRMDCSLSPDTVSKKRPHDEKQTPNFRQLYALRECANLFNQILHDGSLFPPSDLLSLSSSVTMNTDELLRMNLPDLVYLVLGKKADSLDVFSRYKTFLRPLFAIPGFSEMSLDDQEDGHTLSRRIDDAIASYCLDLIRNAGTAPSESASVVQSSTLISDDPIRDALAVCTTITNASRTTIPKSDRIISEKEVLVRLVISAVHDSAVCLRNKSMSHSGGRTVVDMMWEMYECLPKRVPNLETSDVDVRFVLEGVDHLYRELIALDILLSWVQNLAFSLVAEMKSSWSTEARKSGARENVGMKMLSEMFTGFCQHVGKAKDSASSQSLTPLLRDLFADLQQLNHKCFDASLPCGQVLQSHLIRPLLEQEHFNLLAEIVGSGSFEWVQKTDIQKTVLSYLREAMFARDESERIDGNRAQAAIHCQDVLGPLFPDIQAEFHTMRRYLDAASFLANVLCVGEIHYGLHARDIREKPPLDVVEHIMMADPRTILSGCAEWEDPSFAKEANATISRYFIGLFPQPNAAQGSAEMSVSLPPLPGGAIHHLAGILGLDGVPSQVILRSRVVHHAIRSNLFGAAAAACMSLVSDPSLSWGGDDDANVRLTAVEAVVASEDYDDICTKKELCVAVLQRFRGNLSLPSNKAFDTIIRSLALLESRTTSCSDVRREDKSVASSDSGEQNRSPNQEADGPKTVSSRRSKFLVFKAAYMFTKTAQSLVGGASHGESSRILGGHGFSRPSDRIVQYIREHYATDLHELYRELQAFVLRGGGKSVDPLLHTVCRLVMFWSISDSLHTDDSHIQDALERADGRSVLAFGISLLLHIQDKKSGLSLADELQQTSEAEVASMMEDAAANRPPSQVHPDTDIVSRLIGRGYSENGARRSAAMTGNESYESAMAWAVSHSLDPNFDDPIVILKDENGVVSHSVDQGTIHILQQALRDACSIIKGEQKLDILQPSTRSEDATWPVKTKHLGSDPVQTPNNQDMPSSTPEITRAAPLSVPGGEEEKTAAGPASTQINDLTSKAIPQTKNKEQEISPTASSTSVTPGGVKTLPQENRSRYPLRSRTKLVDATEEARAKVKAEVDESLDDASQCGEGGWDFDEDFAL